FVIIAQRVVPECEPMFGVALVIGQQLLYEPLPLVLAPLRNKSLQLLGTGNQTDHIEVNAAGEHPVRNWFWPLDVIGFKILADNAIDRMTQASTSSRKLGSAWRKVFRRAASEGHSRSPGQPLIDPRPQQADFLTGQFLAFLRHDAVRVQA